MSIETTLFLLVSVPDNRRAAFEAALAQARSDTHLPFSFLLRHTDFGTGGSLEFRPSKRHGISTDECRDDEGLVLSIWGEFDEAEDLALWLCQHRAEGRAVQHSREGDAEAWGWEFKNHRIRPLSLSPSSRWRKLKKS